MLRVLIVIIWFVLRYACKGGDHLPRNGYIKSGEGALGVRGTVYSKCVLIDFQKGTFHMDVFIPMRRSPPFGMNRTPEKA